MLFEPGITAIALTGPGTGVSVLVGRAWAFEVGNNRSVLAQ